MSERYPGDPYTLDNVVAELREKLARAERERDEYRSQVHELTERNSRMTSAATGAAATAEAALGRLIKAQVIVDAAYALADNVRERADAKRGAKLLDELVQAVKLHQRGLPS